MEQSRSPSHGLLLVIAGCCLVTVGAPYVIVVRPVPVQRLVIVGGIIASVIGVGAGLIRIVWTRGQPFGNRDPLRDSASRYLRLARRYEFLIASAMIALSVAGLIFDVSWYPRPDPFVPEATAEQYILGPLILELVLLIGGIYWLVLQVYWLSVVRRAGKR
jgi:hypothetical protein